MKKYHKVTYFKYEHTTNKRMIELPLLKALKGGNLKVMTTSSSAVIRDFKEFFKFRMRVGKERDFIA